jgi:integrase
MTPHSFTPHTFAEAAASYVQHGGEARYLPRLLAVLGDRLVHEITPMEVRQLALDLMPDGAASSRNRMVITPARSVLYHAHELGWRLPARIRLFPVSRGARARPATRRWTERFVEQCEADDLPHLAACVLFMQGTGARVSEAVALLGRDVDLGRRLAILRKTKTETDSRRFLPDHVAERIRALAPGPDDRVFRYTSRFSVNERIWAVCDRAGLPRLSSHRVGRHAFATNALNAGVSVRVAMDAGGWRSSVIFLETYAHTIDAGRTVADRFNQLHHQDQF